MPRGLPDYLVIPTQTANNAISDEYMSAYQLGFARLDGGGRVVWFDDFRQGLYNYSLGNAGGGAVPDCVLLNGKNNGFAPSARFDPVANAGQSFMSNNSNLLLSGKVGLEFCVTLPEGHGNFEIVTAPILGYGIHAGYSFKIAKDTNIVSIYTAGAYTPVFTPQTPSYFDSKPITIKIVVDPINQLYDSFFIGSRRVSLGQVGNLNYAGGDGGRMYHLFLHEGGGADYKVPVYLHYVIISADEP